MRANSPTSVYSVLKRKNPRFSRGSKKNLFDSNTHDAAGVFEVDGVSFHGDKKPVQKRRDGMKDHILETLGIPFVRFSTKSALGAEEETAVREMKKWIADKPSKRSNRIALGPEIADDVPDFV